MKRRNHIALAWLLGICAVLTCGVVRADVSFDPVTWGTGGNTLGWSNIVGDANAVTSPATGGNPDGYLAIPFGAVDPLTFQSAEVGTASPGFTGDYSNLGLTFNLLGYQAAEMGLFFVSSAGGASKWTLALDYNPPVDHMWQPYDVDFLSQGLWVRESGSVDFLTAIAQVDSIGVLLRHLSWGEEMTYGVDNWQYYLGGQFYVPEPGVAAMGAVLALSAVIWARRTRRPRRA
jgi:hypothetical protein